MALAAVHHVDRRRRRFRGDRFLDVLDDLGDLAAELGLVGLGAVEERAPVPRQAGHRHRLADLGLAGAVQLGELGVGVDAVMAGDLSRHAQPDQLLGPARQGGVRVELQRLHLFPGARQRLLRETGEELRDEPERLLDVGLGGRGGRVLSRAHRRRERQHRHRHRHHLHQLHRVHDLSPGLWLFASGLPPSALNREA